MRVPRAPTPPHQGHSRTRVNLLIDNGSTRAASTRNLRRLAHDLSARTGEPLHPVSLLHSDKAPIESLDGRPGMILELFLRDQLSAGVRSFLLIPLFFGPSRALTCFIPELAKSLAETFGPFEIKLAPELCPLPGGESRLTAILTDNVFEVARTESLPPRRVVLVDHGSPIPQVSAVRQWLAAQLSRRLGPTVMIEQAVMERRPGSAYDFNGMLLTDRLQQLAHQDTRTPVFLAMLFLSAGRHAGPGGDITEICERVQSAHPGFVIHPSPLVASHPLLLDLLASRLSETDRHTPIPIAS